TGTLSTEAFLVGIPIGLLTTAILWINQFPDEASDKAAGKINLVVALGKEQARYGYLALMLAAFGLVTYWAVSGVFPLGALLFLGGLPLAISASRVLMREYAERTLVRANVATIKLQFVAGALMAAGLLWSDSILGVLGL
ncbi:MAG: prenyltransferase, partial [Chloroflexi bacterium]|nr:prenyltransferase [Chloroflexota bacterium]